MKREDIALDYFKKRFNCAQAVLMAFKDELNVPERELLKISTGFGSGMAEMQLTCGAVTGAFMVISLKEGRSEVEDTKSKEITYYLIEDFVEKFTDINKSINCLDLLGCDLHTDEGRKLYLEKNVRENICNKCVKDAVNILEEIL
jgi:C_GCAxxG_C_C family probable redox protein